MFQLQIGVLKEGVFGHSHPFATPSTHKRPQNHNFLLMFKLYFEHFCIAMSVPTSHGDTKVCKMSRNDDFGGFFFKEGVVNG